MIPTLQDIGANRTVLPLGRYLATMEEVERVYVPEGDRDRRDIWDAFQRVSSIVRQAYGKLAAVWIGGSFVTSEARPQDIDVVFLVTADSYCTAVEEPQGQFVSQILLGANPVVQCLDELVDSFLMVVPPTQMGYEHNYMLARGYWDQFWSKTRFAEGDGRWLYPAAGYLEVIIDGYGA
ncbi:hypothetical protein GKZ27_06365 [Enterorhabdus mucosicola]|uniref:Uncharacterized protein n=1 Tax=Adlercreutzia mucosicola TaxID=580026 RepID=A0A6N8JPP7_9ACTN|nr:hypothetical protein [Adlercreutzia mucosicola]MVX61074.1 hypothetical protein [Adlercreutzia mucosicola]